MDMDYCLSVFQKLLAADSTTGHTAAAEAVLAGLLEESGIPYVRTHKGGIIADAGGSGNALAVTAHLDDIGLMVRYVNADGTLNLCPVGGLYPFYCVTENARVYTRDGRVYSGSICRTPASIHVTEDELRKTLPDFASNVCLVLDEDVRCAADVRALGIDTGDIVALDPRFVRAGEYIKSRFIDDKACAAVLLTVLREIRQQGLALPRKVYAYFAVYEEIGHGTSWLPADVKDILSVDIAPTGPRQNSDERKVSIFAKDSRFPYHWELTNELRETALACGADFVMDIFTPHYGTDGDTSIVAGHDVRHAAIGPGTANSHGYERTHLDGLRNTYRLLFAYLLRA
ncbi:MAG: M42 family metallopeptidase [Lachnospiraceae bacterium]|nr:M42 family metallopeptidase [Lachnospiraceae bacterium]